MSQKIISPLRSSSQSINDLLSGSFQLGNIMLVYALYKRGKTNLCLDYAFNLLKQKKKVLYIDADLGGITETRIRQLLQSKLGVNAEKIDPIKALSYKGMEIQRVGNLKEIRNAIFKLAPGFDLIVIDSLTLYFKTQIMQERGYGRDLAATILAVMDKLRVYCLEHNAAAIITAQRVSEIKTLQVVENARRDGLNPNEIETWRAFVGGEGLAYYVDLIIELHSLQSGDRVLKLIESRSSKPGSCKFKIDDGGIS